MRCRLYHKVVRAVCILETSQTAANDAFTSAVSKKKPPVRRFGRSKKPPKPKKWVRIVQTVPKYKNLIFAQYILNLIFAPFILLIVDKFLAFFGVWAVSF